MKTRIVKITFGNNKIKVITKKDSFTNCFIYTFNIINLHYYSIAYVFNNEHFWASLLPGVLKTMVLYFSVKHLFASSIH